MYPKGPSVRVEFRDHGSKFTVVLSTGTTIVLTWNEWMEFRKVQNSLIYTEPKEYADIHQAT